MDLGLKGKVALVIASSQGLGRAVAEEIAAEGASLVICSRNEGRIDEACKAIGESPRTDILGVTGDVSNSPI